MDCKKQSSLGIINGAVTYKEEYIQLIPEYYLPMNDGKTRLLIGTSEKQVQTLAILREPTQVGVKVSLAGGNRQEEDQTIQSVMVPKVLSFPILKEMFSPEDFLETLDRAFIVYQTLFMQASVNQEKVQQALIIDGSLPESRIAIQVLTKIVKLKTLVVTLDQLDV